MHERLKKLEVEGQKALIFVINGERYYPEEVYKLDRRYVALPELGLLTSMFLKIGLIVIGQRIPA